MSNVKGSALAARVGWVERRHSVAGVRQLLRELDPATEKICSAALLNASWYPFTAFVDLNETIDRIWGAGDLGIVRELARYAADVNLKTIYKVFYKLGSVKWIIDRAAGLWRMNYDTGSLAVEDEEGQRVKLHILDFDTPHRAHCLSVMFWVERSIELSGGKHVEVDELCCRAKGDKDCIFAYEWE